MRCKAMPWVPAIWYMSVRCGVCRKSESRDAMDKTIVEGKTILDAVMHFGASQRTAIFAGVLILTSLVQSSLILQANRVANEAANAAKKTADFLQVTERAYVAEQIGAKSDLLENYCSSEMTGILFLPLHGQTSRCPSQCGSPTMAKRQLRLSIGPQTSPFRDNTQV